jgi:tryptophan synthase alpha chain
MVQNRITQLFEKKKNNILNLYFTAGYPKLQDTNILIQAIEEAGADIIEIGMPYSDPVADGPVIQQSNMVAIDNGMTVKKLLEQLKNIREKSTIPIILMGYFNPVMQYGVENFVKEAHAIGVDGVILPDLPMEEYEREYKTLFETHHLSNIFLITPNTTEARIRKIDEISSGFIYMVSTNSTTGNESKNTDDVINYFERIKNMNLKNPRLIGFNIKDKKSFEQACAYANGAIIGSAYIRMLSNSHLIADDTHQFINNIKN